LAFYKRQLAHVPAVMEQQIERPHGDVIIVGCAEVQRAEVGQAEWVECGHLPAEDEGPCGDSRTGASQRTEARGAVVSVLGVEPNNTAVLVQLDAPAVEFCFVQPVGAARRGGAQHWAGWLDKFEHEQSLPSPVKFTIGRSQGILQKAVVYQS